MIGFLSAAVEEGAGCPADFHPAVLIRTERRSTADLLEMMTVFALQRGVGRVTAVLATHSRDTHVAFLAFEKWWNQGEVTGRSLLTVDVAPYIDLQLKGGSYLHKSWTDNQDVEHEKYVEFHRDMYVLTDVAVMHTLRKYPSVSHVVVTNGDNVYAGNFFAKTCHVQAVSACAGWRGQALGGCVGACVRACVRASA
jgi:hypothetical protein